MSPDVRVVPQSDVRLLFVGSVLPDLTEFHTSAFSRAGTMFQLNLLLGLTHAGIRPSRILSFRHVRIFPRSRRFWIGSGRATLPENLTAILMPFVNATPMKQVGLGLVALLRIAQWGWHNRFARHKVVYSFNLTVPPGLFTLAGARLIGAKAVVSLNDINVPGQTVPNSPAYKLDLLLQRLIIPLFDGHVSVSDRIMRDFAPGRPFVLVEGGVTPEMLPESNQAGGVTSRDGTTFTIVSAGSLDEANGFSVLLEAFAQLEGDEYRLCIAGDGPLAGDVRRAAERDARIRYCGLVAFEEVLALYRSANVLVNMRLTKAMNTRYFFPSKMMEYLASGTPVISTCTGHVESEFGDFVFLLRDETGDGLANMIRHVRSQDSHVLAAMGGTARAYMAMNKTWDAQGRKVADFLESLFFDPAQRDA
jgi:glycosyltransferase involved in cell wall biosynthesis